MRLQITTGKPSRPHPVVMYVPCLQCMPHAIREEDLTRGIREAIDNGDGNELQTLLDGASDTDRERVLLEPYGESGTGLHVGTTPLLHAARCTQPEAFGGLLRASHPKKVNLVLFPERGLILSLDDFTHF